MITELVLLLGFLSFAAIRPGVVRRRGVFVLSLACWGLARFLTEYTFTVGDSGSLSYQYASLPSYAAALCIVLCVLFLFWACRGGPHAARPHDAGSLPGAGEAPGESGTLLSPSERIQQIVEHK